MELYGMLSEQKALAGLLFGMNPKTIVSAPAKEEIDFGKGVFLNGDKTALLNGKHANKATVDLSAYTTASKDIVLVINGVNIEATTTGTIADDVAGIVADIESDVENVSVNVGTGANANKLFLVSDDDSELEVTLSYDGSDVTSSKVSASSDAVYAGVSVFHQNSFKDSRGCYIAKEAVNVMEAGYIWVKLATGVSPAVGADAYVTKDGEFTTSSSGNTKVGTFKSGAESGLALVDIVK
jgi:hypothetical protein